MSLEFGGLSGWFLNRINAGPPFHVERIEYPAHCLPLERSPPQVVDRRGTVAVSGPDGAVFCVTDEQAEALCRMANEGLLEAR